MVRELPRNHKKKLAEIINPDLCARTDHQFPLEELFGHCLLTLRHQQQHD